MATDPKRWLILELRGGSLLTVEVDANISREGLSEWLPCHRLMAIGDVEPQHHPERGLKTPRTIKGEAIKTLGASSTRLSMLGIEDVDDGGLSVRVSEIIVWRETSVYWAEACDKSWESDSKAWKSAMSGIITARVSSIESLGAPGANGAPRLRPMP